MIVLLAAQDIQVSIFPQNSSSLRIPPMRKLHQKPHSGGSGGHSGEGEIARPFSLESNFILLEKSLISMNYVKSTGLDLTG